MGKDRRTHTGIVTADILEKIPGPYQHEFFVNIVEVVFLQLVEQGKILSYYKPNNETSKTADFLVKDINGNEFPFKVFRNSGGAWVFQEKNPEFKTLAIMDSVVPGQTKPTEVIMVDILRRVYPFSEKGEGRR